MTETLPDDWRKALAGRLRSIDLGALDGFVTEERKKGQVYPPTGLEFEALRITHFESVRAVILGQDPYHEPEQAHGLAFSTLGAQWPRSLRNIICELVADQGLYDVPPGNLTPWACNGVLLLNTVLTVRGWRVPEDRAKANSHAGHGWEVFTSAVVDAVAAKPGPIVFMLWGGPAMRKGAGIDRARHIVIESSHPSPLSAARPCGLAPAFRGSHPFQQANAGLKARGVRELDWRLVS